MRNKADISRISVHVILRVAEAMFGECRPSALSEDGSALRHECTCCYGVCEDLENVRVHFAHCSEDLRLYNI